MYIVIYKHLNGRLYVPRAGRNNYFGNFYRKIIMRIPLEVDPSWVAAFTL